MKESRIYELLTNYLRKFFNVWREVKSSDNTARIDYIITHKSDKLKEYPIGIEVKNDEKKTGRNIAAWLKQATRYSDAYFPEFGKVMVITYPQVSGIYLEEGSEMSPHKVYSREGIEHNVSTFLGGFNIGELQTFYDFTGNKFRRIVYNGRLIWDEKHDNFRENNYNKCLKK